MKFGLLLILYLDPELSELSIDSVVLLDREELFSPDSHFSRSELLSSVSFIMHHLSLFFFANRVSSLFVMGVSLLKDDEPVEIDMLGVDSTTAPPSVGLEITLEVSTGCIPKIPCGMSPSVRLSLLSLFSLVLFMVVSVSVNVISPITVSRVVSISVFSIRSVVISSCHFCI